MARTLTGNNRQREQRLQELMLLRMSQQFERRLAQDSEGSARSSLAVTGLTQIAGTTWDSNQPWDNNTYWS